MNRRAILLGLPAFLAAPSIVRAESLMPISVLRLTLDDIYEHAAALGGGLTTNHNGGSASAYAVLGDERRLIGYGKRIGSYDRFGDLYSTNFSLFTVQPFDKYVRSEALLALSPPHRWRWHLLDRAI